MMTQTPSQGSYSIYGLAHPHDMLFRYIGLTQDVTERFKQHMQPSQRSLGTKWIDDLEAQGLHPVLIVIETGIRGSQSGLIRERFWIQHYTELKHPLENVGDNRKTILEKQTHSLEAQTRANRGIEPTTTTTSTKQGCFTQLPASLWTYPGLSVSERWLCATIMRLCWRPGPQPLSNQQLAKEAGISIGALSPGKGEHPREGMIPHLEREGLVIIYRPVDENGRVIRGKSFLIEPTHKLWQINTTSSPQSVYSVNTLQEKETYYLGETVYSVNTVHDVVNTVPHTVNTVHDVVNTHGHVPQGEKRDDEPLNIENIEEYRVDTTAYAVANTRTETLTQEETHTEEERGISSISIPSSKPEKREVIPEEMTKVETDILPSPSQKKTVEKPKNKSVAKTHEKPVKPQVVLSAEEQAVFDEWCKLPWFHGVPPSLNWYHKEILGKLAAYKPTCDDFLAERHWATREENDPKGWYTHKGWSLSFALKEYPNWLSSERRGDGLSKVSEKPKDPRRNFTQSRIQSPPPPQGEPPQFRAVAGGFR